MRQTVERRTPVKDTTMPTAGFVGKVPVTKSATKSTPFVPQNAPKIVHNTKSSLDRESAARPSCSHISFLSIRSGISSLTGISIKCPSPLSHTARVFRGVVPSMRSHYCLGRTSTTANCPESINRNLLGSQKPNYCDFLASGLLASPCSRNRMRGAAGQIQFSRRGGRR